MTSSCPSSSSSSSSSNLQRSNDAEQLRSNTTTAMNHPLPPPTTPKSRFRRNKNSQRTFDDSDEEMSPITKNRKRIAISSPSHFVVKGTVTPSKAAPFFRKPVKIKRKRQETFEDSDSDEAVPDGSDFELASPSRTTSSSSQSSQFVTLAQQLPLMPHPIPLSLRSQTCSTDIQSYLHAMRSNNSAHLSHCSSGNGLSAFQQRRGILGGSASGSSRHLSQRRFYESFEHRKIPHVDMIVLPSVVDDHRPSLPLCAEYSQSSRCLSGKESQWLAIGNNEGQVFLMDTTSGNEHDIVSHFFEAHVGSVFEIKWRSDDRVIATGGSDYKIKLWDTSNMKEIQSFTGLRGTPRSIAWGGQDNPNILASSGRDGAIHFFDMRTPSSSGQDCDAVVSIWDAHTADPKAKRRGGKPIRPSPLGVTSLTFLPSRGSFALCSAGCRDGAIKLWDLRSCHESSAQSSASEWKEMRLQHEESIRPIEMSADVSMQFKQNKRTHGISSMVASSTKVFAACTDGCVYTLSAADLGKQMTTSIGLPCVPLYDEAQKNNTLYSCMALQDDERTLAVGCYSGAVAVWDTHAAGLAATELHSLGVNTFSRLKSVDHREEDESIRSLVAEARPAILKGAHRDNFEINSVTWAHGKNGPVLASVSDDHTIRTWQQNREGKRAELAVEFDEILEILVD